MSEERKKDGDLLHQSERLASLSVPEGTLGGCVGKYYLARINKASCCAAAPLHFPIPGWIDVCQTLLQTLWSA